MENYNTVNINWPPRQESGLPPSRIRSLPSVDFSSLVCGPKSHEAIFPSRLSNMCAVPYQPEIYEGYGLVAKKYVVSAPTLLGTGKTSIVLPACVGRFLQPPLAVAIKIARKAKETYQLAIDYEYRILQILKSGQHGSSEYLPHVYEQSVLNHPSDWLDCCIVPDTTQQAMTKEHLHYMVLEQLGHDIHAEVTRGPLSPSRVKQITFDMLQALSITAEKGVIHLDVKAENLLSRLDEPSRTKLADFGHARYLGAGQVRGNPDRFQTPCCRSPEVILGHNLTTQVDMWSAACTTYEFVTGQTLFRGFAPEQILAEQINQMGMPSKEFIERSPPVIRQRFFTQAVDGTYAPSAAVKGFLDQAHPPRPFRFRGPPQLVPPGEELRLGQLITSMLVFEPERRPTPVEALRYRYFA